MFKNIHCSKQCWTLNTLHEQLSKSLAERNKTSKSKWSESKINSPPATPCPAIPASPFAQCWGTVPPNPEKEWRVPDSIVFTLAMQHLMSPSHRLTIMQRWIWGCEFQIWKGETRVAPTSETHFSPSTECHNGDLKRVKLKIASRKAENEQSKNEQSWSPLGSQVVTGFAH